jgi:predicted nucleotidyltransferase
MLQQKLLEKVTSFLNSSNIGYMVTGSIVSSIQGEPRNTHDIDIVIELKKENVNSLLNEFTTPQFYISKNSVEEAIEKKGMFNIIDSDEGDKIDFWLLSDEDFDGSRFSRKIEIQYANLKFFISTPEDTILAKLRWAKLSGGSEKQMIDAIRVFEINYKILDYDYLKNWISKLELKIEWQKLISEAEPLDL